MSESSTESVQTDGPGRHRGPAAAEDAASAPHGRHRRDSESD
ncbi:hypothetical protein ABT160_01610 [Streptomyces sp. NPDC001941]